MAATEAQKRGNLKYYYTHRDEICARRKAKYALDPEQRAKHRAGNRRWLYGITQEEYDTKLNLQEGVCAICHGLQTQGKQFLAVDHNHTTGEIRGLLCQDCNVALGLLKEDTSRLQNMVAYLLYYGTS